MSSDDSTGLSPAPQTVASARVEVSEATLAQHVREVETQIRRLPPLSGTIREILDQLRDVDSDMGWLEEHISADPSLATRLLKMANSAFYGVRSEVFTIPRALMTLGFRTSLNVLLAASVRSAFGIASEFHGFQPQGLARHSVAVGTCAATLGRSIPSLKPAGDKLFVAGLLHDIGRVALSPLYTRFLEAVRALSANAPPTPEIERGIFGIDHCTAGEMVIRQWRLPSEFVDPITRHHAAAEALENQPLVLGVRAADLFVHGEGYAILEPRDVENDLNAVLAALGTDMNAVRSILSRFEVESEAFLGAVA